MVIQLVSTRPTVALFEECSNRNENENRHKSNNQQSTGSFVTPHPFSADTYERGIYSTDGLIHFPIAIRAMIRIHSLIDITHISPWRQWWQTRFPRQSAFLAYDGKSKNKLYNKRKKQIKLGTFLSKRTLYISVHVSLEFYQHFSQSTFSHEKAIKRPTLSLVDKQFLFFLLVGKAKKYFN